MTRELSVAAVVVSLAVLAGVPACGDSETPHDGPPCQDRDGLVCYPVGFPFVVTAVALSDYCFDLDDPTSCPATTIPPAGSTITRLRQPESGKLCMSGTASADGWAVLALRFLDTIEPLVTRFHPVAAGIVAIEATIDSPPSGGITPSTRGGFHVELASNPGVPLVVSEPGSLIVPLTSFVSNDSPSMTLAPDDVQTFGLDVGAGDYDFCVRDLKFLDAAGNQVTP